MLSGKGHTCKERSAEQVRRDGEDTVSVIALVLARQPHPVAMAVAFALALALAALMVYALQAPRDRKALLDWLGRSPEWALAGLGRLLSPRAWRAAIGRHPGAAVLSVAVVCLAVAGPLVAYRVSPTVRLGVYASRLSERAEGPTFWRPIIREGRPAIPFLISQFAHGETPEERAVNRRVDSALRLTLEWLQSREAFTTTPLPPQPAGRESWVRWWEENEARIPDLGRADDLYNAWRDSYDYLSPSTQ